MKKPKDPSSRSINIPCIKVCQPIGVFFIGSMNHKDLRDISYFDVRRILKEEREIETYLGIQRPLNKKRVREISEYVETVDASFPTSVILAVPGRCASYDDFNKELTLTNYLEGEDEDIVNYGEIARVLDGQHRIEGLSEFKGECFDISVSIFVDIDIADQAYIFSTVNLAQTKVNKSLVYDLFGLARQRSPQKVCHNIAVALDSHPKSPFYRRIKRLGVATDGRFNEALTQATFVQSVLGLMTKNENLDRDNYKRGIKLNKANQQQLKELIFRNMMIDEEDVKVTDILFNYFTAVRNRWPKAWDSFGRGNILNKTNGFKGLMRFLRFSYLYCASPGQVPSVEEFSKIFIRIDLDDDYFNTDNFKPGTSGEAELYRVLVKECGLK